MKIFDNPLDIATSLNPEDDTKLKTAKLNTKNIKIKLLPILNLYKFQNSGDFLKKEIKHIIN